ncbi:MAG: NUDIX domain-containing protein [Bacteroidota bacterium]
MPTFSYCPVCGKELIKAQHGGKERQACPDPSCGWVHWDNPTPVVAAVVERKGKVVLVRNVGWPEKWFGLVTGFLERNETPEEGILREVKEEIGLDATMGSLIGLYPFYMRNQLIIAYHVEAHEGEIVLQESEIAECKEIPMESIRPWKAATGVALKDWLASKGIESEFR